MPCTCGRGPAHGASRPARPAPSAKALTAGRSVHAAWCMPSPQAPALGINHSASARGRRLLVAVLLRRRPEDVPGEVTLRVENLLREVERRLDDLLGLG